MHNFSWSVQPSMFAASHQFQVFEAVIPAIPVLVMHYLIKTQSAANRLRHNVPVHQNPPTAISHRMSFDDDKYVLSGAFGFHSDSFRWRSLYVNQRALPLSYTHKKARRGLGDRAGVVLQLNLAR